MPHTPATRFSESMWTVVEETALDEGALREALNEMSKDDLVEFHSQFYLAMRTLWDHMDSSGHSLLHTVHGDPISEDGKQDIYSLVVSRGRAFYNEVWEHPGLIPLDVDPGDVPAVWVPGKLFWERFEEEITDYQSL